MKEKDDLRGHIVPVKAVKASTKVMKGRYQKFCILSEDGTESPFGGTIFIKKGTEIPEVILLKLRSGDFPANLAGIVRYERLLDSDLGQSGSKK